MWRRPYGACFFLFSQSVPDQQGDWKFSIGNLLGEQNAKRAGIAANTALVMALLIAGISRSFTRVFAVT